MQVEKMAVDGAWVFTPEYFEDSRGQFVAPFQLDSFARATGQSLDVRQVNMSYSVPGALRGIHVSDVPPGQAKYVTCVTGSVWDVVVDLRTGSPTFGQWDAVELSVSNHRAVYLSEGLGHGFLSTATDEISTVMYLCSSGYLPEKEVGVDPFDVDLDISWPLTRPDGTKITPVISNKDRTNRSLAALTEVGATPSFELCRDWIERLRSGAE